jgi:hypothetical protein
MAGELNITSEQLDNLFLYANGELTEEEWALYSTKIEDE